MAFITTNTVKPTVDDAQKPLRHIRVEDVKPKEFDLHRIYPNVQKRTTNKVSGPMFTADMREIEENKKRLAASAAKRLALAKKAAGEIVDDVRGKKAPAKRKATKKAK